MVLDTAGQDAGQLAMKFEYAETGKYFSN